MAACSIYWLLGGVVFLICDDMETPPDPTEPESEATDSSELSVPPTLEKKPDHTMPMLCHLLALTALLGIPFGNVLGPLIIWLIKKEENPAVDVAGKESINFQVSVMIYGFVLFLLGIPMAIIPFVNMLLIPLLVLAGISLMVGTIALTVIAALKASEGQEYIYPYTIRFLK
ncbi:MAG: DUF4870 domain-containing protein [Opitutales bacterium]|nr:DUF4870 domain-containing protein [Opitutales bacterium]